VGEDVSFTKGIYFVGEGRIAREMIHQECCSGKSRCPPQANRACDARQYVQSENRTGCPQVKRDSAASISSADWGAYCSWCSAT
jgi:hypothetical protein